MTLQFLFEAKIVDGLKYIYIYIYIYIYSRMVDVGESDKMMKISGKMDKSDTYKQFSSDISFSIQEFLQTKHFFF